MERIFLRADLFQIPDLSGMWEKGELVKSVTEADERKAFLQQQAKTAKPEKKEPKVPKKSKIEGPLAPVSGPDVRTPEHQLATHEAAQSYAKQKYLISVIKNDPEFADQMLQMYRAQGGKADKLREQGFEATPQHHEDLAAHYHMNSGHYDQSGIPAQDRVNFHLQHAGKDGADMDKLAEKYQQPEPTNKALFINL